MSLGGGGSLLLRAHGRSAGTAPDAGAAADGLGDIVDDLDELLTPVAVAPGELHEFAGPGHDRAPVRGPGNGDSPPAAELQQPLISQRPQRPQHGVGVHVQHSGQIPRGRKPLTRTHLTVGDGPADLGAHLIVEGQPVPAIHLDTEHGASQTSTMRAAPPVAAPRAGTPAEAQAVIEQARAHARRRRRKTALAVITISAALGGGLAGAGALSGSGPAARGGPSQSLPLTARTGGVTGYIDPCEAISTGLPYAAGTVTALRGQETWEPAGDGTYRLQLPATVAARQHVGQNQKFYFDLAPGRYVLVARYDRGIAMTFLDVSIVAGRVLHRDLPDLCM
jgi:hypothetical protein